MPLPLSLPHGQLRFVLSTTTASFSKQWQAYCFSLFTSSQFPHSIHFNPSIIEPTLLHSSQLPPFFFYPNPAHGHPNPSFTHPSYPPVFIPTPSHITFHSLQSPSCFSLQPLFHTSQPCPILTLVTFPILLPLLSPTSSLVQFNLSQLAAPTALLPLHYDLLQY